jgi:DNA-directed RNA polymerase specialized sigma24 family protein
MDGEEWPVSERSEDEAERSALQKADVDLLIGIRGNDVGALRRFALRFEPILMDQARRLGIGQEERRTVVTGFLDDILVKLADAPAPRSLIAFVITSFRNCVTDLHREASTRERHSRSIEEMIGAERVVRSTCSEFMLRAARGADSEDDSASSAGVALVRALLDGCSQQERQLLVWSAHRVPLRECAAWLGISYDSAKQRLSRLRARLVRDSIARISVLPASDRAELTRLLRRSGVTIDNEQMTGVTA